MIHYHTRMNIKDDQVLRYLGITILRFGLFYDNVVCISSVQLQALIIYEISYKSKHQLILVSCHKTPGISYYTIISLIHKHYQFYDAGHQWIFTLESIRIFCTLSLYIDITINNCGSVITT